MGRSATSLTCRSLVPILPLPGGGHAELVSPPFPCRGHRGTGVRQAPHHGQVPFALAAAIAHAENGIRAGKTDWTSINNGRDLVIYRHRGVRIMPPQDHEMSLYEHPLVRSQMGSGAVGIASVANGRHLYRPRAVIDEVEDSVVAAPRGPSGIEGRAQRSSDP